MAHKPEILWAPGWRAEEDQTEKLAVKLGLLCRRGRGPCLLGSKGELSTARAMRAIAIASEARKAPLEFRVRWQEEGHPAEEARDAAGGATAPRAMRWLRFHAQMRYDWAAFRRHWEQGAQGRSRPMPVTPQTAPLSLAVALVTEARKRGGAALSLNPHNDAVMSVAAKALAALPRAAGQNSATEDPGELQDTDLVCVLRWPQTHGAARVYAHVLPGNAISP